MESVRAIEASLGTAEFSALFSLSFSTENLNAIQSVEMIVSGLVGCGWGYEQIKEFILAENLKLLVA